MDAIRHMALGCCVLSTVAGMIRMFWPENAFAPVINAVLALYIITAGMQMLHAADWSVLTAQLYQLASTGTQRADYTEYGREIALSASVEAIRHVLQQAGVEAVVTLRDGVCRVELLHGSDRDRAQALLDASCEDLPWEISEGGDMP